MEAPFSAYNAIYFFLTKLLVPLYPAVLYGFPLPIDCKVALSFRTSLQPS